MKVTPQCSKLKQRWPCAGFCHLIPCQTSPGMSEEGSEWKKEHGKSRENTKQWRAETGNLFSKAVISLHPSLNTSTELSVSTTTQTYSPSVIHSCQQDLSVVEFSFSLDFSLLRHKGLMWRHRWTKDWVTSWAARAPSQGARLVSGSCLLLSSQPMVLQPPSLISVFLFPEAYRMGA